MTDVGVAIKPSPSAPRRRPVDPKRVHTCERCDHECTTQCHYCHEWMCSLHLHQCPPGEIWACETCYRCCCATVYTEMVEED